MQLVRHLCILAFHHSCICRTCRFWYNNSRGRLGISTLICAPNSEVNGGNKRTSKAFGLPFSLHAVLRKLRDRRKRRKHIRPRGLLQSLIRRPLPPLYLQLLETNFHLNRHYQLYWNRKSVFCGSCAVLPTLNLHSRLQKARYSFLNPTGPSLPFAAISRSLAASQHLSMTCFFFCNLLRICCKGIHSALVQSLKRRPSVQRYLRLPPPCWKQKRCIQGHILVAFVVWVACDGFY